MACCQFPSWSPDVLHGVTVWCCHHDEFTSWCDGLSGYHDELTSWCDGYHDELTPWCNSLGGHHDELIPPNKHIKINYSL